MSLNRIELNENKILYVFGYRYTFVSISEDILIPSQYLSINKNNNDLDWVTPNHFNDIINFNGNLNNGLVWTTYCFKSGKSLINIDFSYFNKNTDLSIWTNNEYNSDFAAIETKLADNIFVYNTILEKTEIYKSYNNLNIMLLNDNEYTFSMSFNKNDYKLNIPKNLNIHYGLSNIFSENNFEKLYINVEDKTDITVLYGNLININTSVPCEIITPTDVVNTVDFKTEYSDTLISSELIEFDIAKSGTGFNLAPINDVLFNTHVVNPIYLSASIVNYDTNNFEYINLTSAYQCLNFNNLPVLTNLRFNLSDNVFPENFLEIPNVTLSGTYTPLKLVSNYISSTIDNIATTINLTDGYIQFENPGAEIDPKLTTTGRIYYRLSGNSESKYIRPLTFMLNDMVTSVSASILLTKYTKFTTNLPKIQYRFGLAGDWIDYKFPTAGSGEILTIDTTNTHRFLQFRNLSGTFSKDATNNISFKTYGDDIVAIGNLDSLINYYNINDTLPAYTFYKLFNNCKNLVTPPELPFTELSNNCYESMFEGCDNLKTIPELPAMSIPAAAYKNMFANCINIKITSGLPATELSGYCYEGMFSGCTSFNEVPELPATQLTIGCYKNMFANTKVSEIPTISATVLTPGCFEGMFNTCNKITKLSGAFDTFTTLASACYKNMFSNCSGLIEADSLPVTGLSNYCYDGMFKNCTSLINAPELPAITAIEGCYSNMFAGCTALESSPSLPMQVLAKDSYDNMFNGCSSLSYIDTALSVNNTNNTNNWVNGVAANGIFVGTSAYGASAASINTWPVGWTYLDTSEFYISNPTSRNILYKFNNFWNDRS